MKRPSFRPGYWGAGFIAVMITPILTLAASPQGQDGAVAGHHVYHGAHAYAHGPLTIILAVVALVLVTVFVMKICGKRCHAHHGNGHSDVQGTMEKSALEMLKVRFACGEIAEEEYKSRKKVLEE